MPYEPKTQAMREALVRRDKEHSCGLVDQEIDARVRELMTTHQIADQHTLMKMASEDAVVQRLAAKRILTEMAPEIMLATGYVPVLGEPGEPIRWRQPSAESIRRSRNNTRFERDI